MDSDKYMKENDVSDPLKHLLSLDWESTPTSKSKDFPDDEEQSKSVKKVRFSDEVEEILCDIDTSEIYVTKLSILEKNRNICTDHAYCVPLSKKLSEASSQEEVQAELNSKVELNGTDDESGADDEFELLANKSVITFHPSNVTNENTLLEMEDFENKNVMSENGTDLTKLHEDIQTVSNVSEIDIDNLADQIENMSIHPSQESNLPENHECNKVFTDQNVEHHSEIHTSVIGDDKPDFVLQKNSQPLSEERKEHRIHQKLSNEKQSRKLNSVLTKETNISSASELKTTVFKAWCKVKNKTKKNTEISSSICETTCIETSLKKSKEHFKPASKHAYTLWKKSKKNKVLQSEPKKQHQSKSGYSVSQEISKTDEEEREMAFKSWKKRKDEILKNECVKEKRKEQQCIQISSMNAIQKKKDSEEAFLAWEAHKYRLMEIESKKKAWLQQKEQEEYAKKSLRDKEALEMYYLWLETKHLACETNSTSSTQLKPPWIPPGKSYM